MKFLKKVQPQLLLAPKLDLLIVSLIGLLFSFSMSPSQNASLGLTSTDDSPILPATALNDIANDSSFKISSPENSVILMWTTITKWLPAIMYRFLGIDPEIFHTVFVFSQITLILIGTFRLSESLKNSREISYLAIGLLIIYESYFINMGAYGGQTFMPYTTWISVGPLLFSWANYIEGTRKRAFAYLILGTLIHPAMGLMMAILLFVTFAISKKLSNVRSYLKEGLLVFVPVGIIGILGTMPLRLEQYRPTPESWQKLDVFHWAAWNLYDNQVYFQQSKYALIFILSILAITIYFRDTLKNVFALTLLVITISLVCVLAQALFYTLNVRQISSINLSRITIFTSILLTIIGARIFSSLINSKAETKNWLLSGSMIFILLFSSSLTLMILSLLVLIHSFINKNPMKLNILLLSTSLIILCLYLSNLFDINKDTGNLFWQEGNFFIPATLSNRALYNYLGSKAIFVIAILYIAFILLKRNQYIKHFAVMFVLILSLSTIVGRLDLSIERQQQSQDWINLQIWAKNNSSSGETFLSTGETNLHGGWTTLTRRYLVNADSNEGGNLYLFSKSDKQYEILRSQIVSDPNEIKDIDDFEMYIERLASNVDARFLISSDKLRNLKFPTAYSNSKYVIYIVR